MPKQKQADVNNLLNNMKGQAARARAPQKVEQRPANAKPDSLHRYIDLAPYKDNEAYPGRTYLLVGNSYNMERKVSAGARKSKRASSIAMLLQESKGNHGCVKVEDALHHAGFVETLSRFEYDWLTREHKNSLIGPAYDEHGKHLPNSFAVWRYDYSQKQKQPKVANQANQLVGAH